MSLRNKISSVTGAWLPLLNLAWPLIVANAFWNLQITIDRMFLGQYSPDALGASLAVFGVFWAPMALLQQTAAYVATFVAQYYGAKRFSDLSSSLWQSAYVSIAGGLLFLVFIPLAPWLFSLFEHSPTMEKLEVEYFSTLCYSALPTALLAALSSFYTGLGKSKVILILNGTGLVMNVLFDYLFVFGNLGFPALGVAGAGYATSLATALACVPAVCLLARKEYREKFSVFKHWKPRMDMLWRFLRFGVPSGLQWALEGLAFTFFLIFLGRMPNGDQALTGSGITITIMMLSVLPIIGVGQAVSVMVGQAIGEGRPVEGVKTTWSGIQMSFVYIFIMSMSFLFMAEVYTSLFVNDDVILADPQLLVMVKNLLRFVALFTFFDSMNIVFSFALRGAGDTRFVSIMALLLPWPLMVLPTWLVSTHETGVYWAWAGASLFICVQGMVFMFRFLGGKWKSMDVMGNASSD